MDVMGRKHLFIFSYLFLYKIPAPAQASMDHSPSSSKLYLPGSERGDEDSFTTKSIIKQPPTEEKPAPIERVPPLPVVVFLSFYLIVGKE